MFKPDTEIEEEVLFYDTYPLPKTKTLIYITYNFYNQIIIHLLETAV